MFSLFTVLREPPYSAWLTLTLLLQSYALGLLVTAPLFWKITSVFPADANLWVPVVPAKADH